MSARTMGRIYKAEYEKVFADWRGKNPDVKEYIGRIKAWDSALAKCYEAAESSRDFKFISKKEAMAFGGPKHKVTGRTNHKKPN